MENSQTKSIKEGLAADDYLEIYRHLFEVYSDSKGLSKPKRGRPTSYSDQDLILFFTVMQVKNISCFKSQFRWLKVHSDERKMFGFGESIPHRATLSRRFKALEKTLADFIVFIGQWADSLDKKFNQRTLYIDGSLFTSKGGKWHASNRREGTIPKGATDIDFDSSWRKSRRHGWVQGYSLHLITNYHGFPIKAQVETGKYSESHMVADNEDSIEQIRPKYVIGDNGYHECMRVLKWEEIDIHLITPAESWKKGEDAIAYHKKIEQPTPRALLARRGIVIEPIFDLVSKLIGTRNNHKQLPVKRISNVRTFILLGVLSLQVIMLSNYYKGRPFREISYFLAAMK